MISFEEFKAAYEKLGARVPPEVIAQEYKKYQDNEKNKKATPTAIPPSAKKKASDVAKKAASKAAVASPLKSTVPVAPKSLDKVLEKYNKPKPTSDMDIPPPPDFGGAFKPAPAAPVAPKPTGLEKYSIDVPTEEANKPLDVQPMGAPTDAPAPLDPTTLDFGEDKDETSEVPAEPIPTEYVNEGRETTSNEATSKKEYLPEDMTAIQAANELANKEGRSAFDKYKSIAEKEDEFDVSGERKDVIDEYTKGMDGADKVRFINAIMENLGKITSGAVGLKTGGNVASNFSYKALDPESMAGAAKDKYGIKDRDITARVAENKSKQELDLAKAEGLYNKTTDVNKDQIERAQKLADMRSSVISNNYQETNKLLSRSEKAEQRRIQANKELENAIKLMNDHEGNLAAVAAATKNVGASNEVNTDTSAKDKREYMAEGQDAIATMSAGILGIVGNPAYKALVNKAIASKNPQDMDEAYAQLTTALSNSIQRNSVNPSAQKKLQSTLQLLARLKSARMLTPEALMPDAMGGQRLYELNDEWMKRDEAASTSKKAKESVNLKGPMTPQKSTNPPPANTPPAKVVTTPVAAKPVSAEQYEKAKRILQLDKNPANVELAKQKIKQYEAQSKK